MIKTELTQSRLKELLHYDPVTGVFTWLTVLGNRAKVGVRAGSFHTNGYIYIGVDSSRYRAHRLAHLYMTGEWPKDEIDHIDRDKSNNAWPNLREATRAQNMANRSILPNRLGLKGVQKTGTRYKAQIKFGGKKRYLGYFSTPEEAHAAYCEAADRFHGEFARTQ